MLSYPLMWATAAALRSDTPARRVDDALAVVRRMLLAGADPSAMDLRVAVRPEGKESVRGRVALYERLVALGGVRPGRVAARHNTLRRKLGVMLGECGARSRFRASTAMDLVAARAEPHAETRGGTVTANDDDGDARVGRRGDAREILELLRVPPQYAVWVWPSTEDERRPPEDRLVDADPSTLASSYAGAWVATRVRGQRASGHPGSDRSHPGVGRDARASRTAASWRRTPRRERTRSDRRRRGTTNKTSGSRRRAANTRTLRNRRSDGNGNDRGRRYTRAWWRAPTFLD